MNPVRRIGLLVVIATLVSACTWVEPTAQGEKVRVLAAEEVTKCRKVGQTTVSLLARLAGIERNPQKVQDELNILARNSAVELDGDTVVPISVVEDGKQTFAVYRCIPR
ncbi:MAG: DUF4156 domain-containing protein [Thiohalomonadaceae bacterium]